MNMKKITLILSTILGLGLLYSCEKDGELAYIANSDQLAAPVVTLPAANAAIVMTKPEATTKVTFTWKGADYGVAVGIQYKLQMDKKGNAFKDAVEVLSSYNLTEVITYDALNTKCTALGLVNAQVNDVEVRIVGSVPNSNAPVLTSAPVALKITPYSNKDKFFMVGSFVGWNAAVAVQMNGDLPGLEYNLFVYLPGGSEFKFIPKQGAWDNDMGASKTDAGKLVVDGEDNLKITDAGIYEVHLDLKAMTWVVTNQAFGLIGSATPGDWNNSTPMTFDAATKRFTCTVDLIGGKEFKFRANNKWDYNFGDNGNDGSVEKEGANIPVLNSGNYTVTLQIGDAVAPVVAPAQYPITYSYTIKKN